MKSSHAIDLFAVSLDQTGLLEMQQLVKKTGGVIVMADSFTHEIFQRSLQKLFEKDESGQLKMAFNATIEVIVSLLSSSHTHTHTYIHIHTHSLSYRYIK
jgi:protein transport protein SEC23